MPDRILRRLMRISRNKKLSRNILELSGEENAQCFLQNNTRIQVLSTDKRQPNFPSWFTLYIPDYTLFWQSLISILRVCIFRSVIEGMDSVCPC